jgi:peptidoglycan/xylan/chitin deacetylase (PgdA/CDA1 family)
MFHKDRSSLPYLVLFGPLTFVYFFSASFSALAATTSTLGPNLIQNPQLETPGTGGMPASWNEGNWGTNTTSFSYPVTGVSGLGANVAISAYTSGDSKWYFNNVTVAPGMTYAFSDSYSSTIPSLLVAQFTSQTNALSYVQLGGTLPATNGAWANASATFVPPASTAGVTIFHLIQGVGSLTTDNYFLGTVSTSTTTSTPPVPTLTINPTTLPNGTVGTPYAQSLTASTTASGPFTWSILSGSLPPGLNLGASTGATDAISGTPATSTTSSFTIKATNGTSSSTQNYTVSIAPATVQPPPTSTSTLAVNITMNGGSSTPANFNLTVKDNTSTLFNGAATATQSFVLNIGSSYSVSEATTTNSQNYAPLLSGNCIGTATTSSATCTITNNFVPPISSTSTPTSTTNLILNPSLTTDTKTPGIPDNWNEGGWGTNTVAFNYPVAGVSGGTGANITISSYTSGDEKWYFNNVFVTPGDSYTFTDSYNATVSSYLVAQFTGTDGSLSYTDIATLPATGGAWANTSQTITAPGNAAAVTVFHLIQSAGSLTTTNYSLAPVSNGTGSNLFPEGLVSLTFDDGWQSQYDNALPIMQAANMHGTFYIISSGMQNAIETTFPSTDNPFNVATTTKTAVWSQIYTDPTQHSFIFSDTYTATAPSTITVKYKPASGTATTTVIGKLPVGTNATATLTFTLPVLGASAPLTITQAVTGTNTLTAKNPLLQQPVGYMDTNHVLAMQAAGEEIGDHTVNHCDLAAIDGNPTNTASCAVNPPASTTDQLQIDNARTALLGAGLAPVDTFAYPYGSGAGQSDIEADVAADGLISARSVNTGYNTKNTDLYDLLNQAVDASVKDPSTIQGWINYAATNHVWLILTFHQVELSTSTITKNKETDATTAAMLQATVTYLQQQEAAGKIDVDTVHNIMTQFMK